MVRDVRSAYRSDDWIDLRVEARPSPIAGRGLFATAAIRAGEVVVIWGGDVVEVYRKGCVAIGEAVYLGGAPGPSDLMNHSCEPNVWMQDEVTLVARRDIAAGDEVTIDYALFQGDEAWTARWRCRCGAARCRGAVSGQDWRSAELQTRYGRHFSPFINERIARES